MLFSHEISCPSGQRKNGSGRPPPQGPRGSTMGSYTTPGVCPPPRDWPVFSPVSASGPAQFAQPIKNAVFGRMPLRGESPHTPPHPPTRPTPPPPTYPRSPRAPLRSRFSPRPAPNKPKPQHRVFAPFECQPSPTYHRVGLFPPPKRVFRAMKLPPFRPATAVPMWAPFPPPPGFAGWARKNRPNPQRALRPPCPNFFFHRPDPPIASAPAFFQRGPPERGGPRPPPDNKVGGATQRCRFSVVRRGPALRNPSSPVAPNGPL